MDGFPIEIEEKQYKDICEWNEHIKKEA